MQSIKKQGKQIRSNMPKEIEKSHALEVVDTGKNIQKNLENMRINGAQESVEQKSVISPLSNGKKCKPTMDIVVPTVVNAPNGI